MVFDHYYALPRDFEPPLWLFDRLRKVLHQGGHLHLVGPSDSGKSVALTWLARELSQQHQILELDSAQQDMPWSFYREAGRIGWVKQAILASERCLDQGGTRTQALQDFLGTYLEDNGLNEMIIVLDNLDEPEEVRAALQGHRITLLSAGGETNLEGALRLTGPDQEALIRKLLKKGELPAEQLEDVVKYAKGSLNLASIYCQGVSKGFLQTIPPPEGLCPALLNGAARKFGKTFSQEYKPFLESLAKSPERGLSITLKHLSLSRKLEPLVQVGATCRLRLPSFAAFLPSTVEPNPFLEELEESSLESIACLDLTFDGRFREAEAAFLAASESLESYEDYSCCLSIQDRYAEAWHYLQEALRMTDYSNTNPRNVCGLHYAATHLCLNLARYEEADYHFGCAMKEDSQKDDGWWGKESLRLHWIRIRQPEILRSSCRALLDRFSPTEFPSDYGMALNELAEIQFLDGDWDLALATSRQARDAWGEESDEYESRAAFRDFFIHDQMENTEACWDLISQREDIEWSISTRAANKAAQGKPFDLLREFEEELEEEVYEPHRDPFGVSLLQWNGYHHPSLRILKEYFRYVRCISERRFLRFRKTTAYWCLGHYTKAGELHLQDTAPLPIPRLELEGDVMPDDESQIYFAVMTARILMRTDPTRAVTHLKDFLAGFKPNPAVGGKILQAALLEVLSEALEKVGCGQEALDLLADVPTPQAGWKEGSVVRLTQAHRRRGEISMALGRADEAVVIFQESLVFLQESHLLAWPKDLEKTFNIWRLGQAYAHLGGEKLGQALICLEEALGALEGWLDELRPQIMFPLLQCCRDWLSHLLVMDRVREGLPRLRRIFTKVRDLGGRFPSEALSEELEQWRLALNSDRWPAVLSVPVETFLCRHWDERRAKDVDFGLLLPKSLES
jgi:tetratricopeptide (TPR) repeat protein